MAVASEPPLRQSGGCYTHTCWPLVVLQRWGLAWARGPELCWRGSRALETSAACRPALPRGSCSHSSPVPTRIAPCTRTH